MTNLNSMEKLKEDNHNTSYMKYKLYKCEAYGLVLVDWSSDEYFSVQRILESNRQKNVWNKQP